MADQLHVVLGARVDGARVLVRKQRVANDVRDDQEDDLVRLLNLVAAGEEVLQDGQLTQAGRSSDGVVVLVGQNAGQQAGLAVLELDGLLRRFLRDDRLYHPAFQS